MSENSSNLILPATVLPIMMSKKTMGRPFVPAPVAVDVAMLRESEREQTGG
jgi:hypothetical protein